MTAMHKFTLGTTPENIIRQELPDKYKMELNKNDMVMLLDLLDINGSFNSPEAFEELTYWAANFRSNILQTINIEEI